MSRTVRSSRVVLPAPGELVRFSATMSRVGQPLPITLCQFVVLGQHLLLQGDRFGHRKMNVFVLAVVGVGDRPMVVVIVDVLVPVLDRGRAGR